MVAFAMPCLVVASTTLPTMRPSEPANALPANARTMSAPNAVVLCMLIPPWTVPLRTTHPHNLFWSQDLPTLRGLVEAEVGLVFQSPLEVLPVVLRHGQHLADRLAGNLLFDVEAAFFVLIEEHMDLVDAAKEVMDVAHDVLIGASEKDAEVIGLAVAQLVERQCFADVMEIDVLRHLAIGIAGDVDQGRLELRPLIEPVDRHDGEELAESPMIEQRLEDGEVADVLIGELDLEVPQILGHFLGIHLLHDGLQLLRDLPEELLDSRLRVEVQQAELEHVLGLLLDLDDVVPALGDRVFAEPVIRVDDLPDQFVVGGTGGERLEWSLLDGAERLHHQNGVVGNDGPA